MSDYRKSLVDCFEDHLQKEYHDYCERHQISETISSMITFLLDRDLIPESTMRKFAIWHEFQPLFEKKEQHKTSAVATLADRFNLSERTIWSILRHKELEK